MFTGFFGLLNCGSSWKISTNSHSENKTLCAREKTKAYKKKDIIDDSTKKRETKKQIFYQISVQQRATEMIKK